MFIQITDAGAQILQTGPFQLTSYKLGSSLNYTPDPAATDIRGDEVWSGVPGPGVAQSSNIVRYSFLLDRSAGDFDFGEIAYFQDDVCVAIAVSSSLIEKRKTETGVDGNMMRVDAFLSMVGEAYEMWVNLGSTDNKFVFAVINSIDQLPQSHTTVTNGYIVGTPAADQHAFMAYTDRRGLWVFDQYKFSTTINHVYTVVGSSALSVTIQGSLNAGELRPSVTGEKILQFVTGRLYSACRNIVAAIEDPATDTTTLTFETPLALDAAPGDEFAVFNRDPLAANSINIPVATRDSLGIVQVGDGLGVENGLVTVDLDYLKSRFVTAILGKGPGGETVKKVGDVQIVAQDVEGAVLTVNNQGPDSQGNVEIVLPELPMASPTVLGGVRVSSGSGITIDAGGQIAVDAQMFGGGIQTFNGRSPDSQGDIQVIGLIDPEEVANPNFDALTTVGIVCVPTVGSALNGPPDLKPGVLEVTPLRTGLSGGVLQVWHQEDAMSWRVLGAPGASGAWQSTSQTVATTSRLGSVIVGDGLDIDSQGVLETALKTVAGKGPDQEGDIALTATDVQAIPYAEKGAQGGVATLDKDPDDPTDPIADKYIYGRIQRDMAALESLTIKGNWDAANNSAIVTVGGVAQNWALLNNGVIRVIESGVTTTIAGTGTVLFVEAPGTTLIDGQTNWEVGQLVVGVPGRWLKLSAVPPIPAQDYELGVTVLAGVPAASSLFFQPFARSMRLEPGSPHGAACQVSPSSPVTYLILINDAEVGRIAFDGTSTQAQVVVDNTINISPGDVIEITSPANTAGQIGLSVVLTFVLIL